MSLASAARRWARSRAGDCDVFGRMRTEQMMARISRRHSRISSTASGRAPTELGERAGGAALEYRLIHLDWPRAGDRVELRSGASGGDARFRRLTHWLLDPDSGRAWGVAEAIAVSFDLETRKIDHARATRRWPRPTRR